MIIALTGHRPEDCEDEATVRRKLREALESASGVTTVISGMASGVDLWGGDIALSLGLDVWAAKPWAGHGPRAEDRELYARVIEGARRVVNVDESEEYLGPWLYHNRNHWMVDNATHVLAYLNPNKTSGGTYACVQYAMKQEKPIRNIYG